MTLPLLCLAGSGRICYNAVAVTPSGREEVFSLSFILTLLISVVAGVITHCICKWLDGKK